MKHLFSASLVALVCLAMVSCGFGETDPAVIAASPFYYQLEGEESVGHLINLQEDGIFDEAIVSSFGAKEDLTYCTIGGTWEVKEDNTGKYIVLNYILDSFDDYGNGLGDTYLAFFEEENAALEQYEAEGEIYGYGPYAIDDAGNVVYADNPDYCMLYSLHDLMGEGCSSCSGSSCRGGSCPSKSSKGSASPVVKGNKGKSTPAVINVQPVSGSDDDDDNFGNSSVEVSDPVVSNDNSENNAACE